MRRKGKLICLVGVAALVPAAGQALEPDELFQKVSPSIVAIHGFDTRVKPFTYGSGVVVGPETVITNCHVLAKTRTILVKRGNATYKATLQYPDVERDLCQLNVPDLNAPAVTLGHSTSIRIGQRTFAIGNPIGLELTLSDGLISGFRKIEGHEVPRIQTSAPASPGSSGGGLFDRDGNLIGITTLIGRDAQNITIAHPVEWVREVPERGKAAMARRAGPSPASASATAAGAYPRQLTGEEVAEHYKTLRKVEVTAPDALMSLTFQPGNRFVILYLHRNVPSGVRQEGTYSVKLEAAQVCFNLAYVAQSGGGIGVGSEWMGDCFVVSQTDEKTYSLKTPKGDSSLSYKVP
jgi:S1-C subfamily serine protease